MELWAGTPILHKPDTDHCTQKTGEAEVQGHPQEERRKEGRRRKKKKGGRERKKRRRKKLLHKKISK